MMINKMIKISKNKNKNYYNKNKKLYKIIIKSINKKI